MCDFRVTRVLNTPQHSLHLNTDGGVSCLAGAGLLVFGLGGISSTVTSGLGSSSGLGVVDSRTRSDLNTNKTTTT